MDKSQLRRLARDYAVGDLDREDYVRRRAEIVDDIVAGRSPIERHPAGAPPPGGAVSLARSFKASPLYVLVGACVVVAVFWTLFASRAPATRREPLVPASDASSERIPAARALVEGFLSERDWSEASVAEFRASWHALTPNEQAEARASPWFTRLAEALRVEINAHKALAEFDGSGAASATGRRLAGFGEFLGIADALPEVSPDVPPSALESTADGGMIAESAAPAAGGQQAGAPPTAWQWVEAQEPDYLTLQLYAVNYPEPLEQLMAEHPDLELRLLVFEGGEPRYRLVHGAFADEHSAREAYGRLPASLTREQPAPFVRSMKALREERDQAGANPTPSTPSEPSASYTLQLLASTSLENAERLASRYQSLDLRVHASHDEPRRYRVLYGTFESPEEARRAGATLPPGILQEIGEPVVRPTAEFQ